MTSDLFEEGDLSRATGDLPTHSTRGTKKRRRERPPRRCFSTTDFPTLIEDNWEDPHHFRDALVLHMRRHGETCYRLFKAVVRDGENFDLQTLVHWRRGTKRPRSVKSLAILGRIEQRYRLPSGYFREKLPHRARSATGHDIRDIGAAERRRIAWHLPDDFNSRPPAEQQEILSWVRNVIVSGATDYRKFQSKALKHRYGIRFPNCLETAPVEAPTAEDDEDWEEERRDEPEIPTHVFDAPPRLAAEMARLIRFKTATLTEVGFQRVGVWGEETADQKIEHLGLMFGAMVAHPRSPMQGLGVALHKLTLGLLVFPAIWDWYVQWRERRRGFYTVWEVDMLRVALALAREKTGWLRQSPDIAAHLHPVDGLVSRADIQRAKKDWGATCDGLMSHASSRAKEIERVARVHRDSFEAILPILEAESPLAEYRKITDEILERMPDKRLYPLPAAEAARSYLLLRFGMHLGLRQKNLRQLLVCGHGQIPRTEKNLSDRKRGELRWSERHGGWEVFIPFNAFKNAHSSYFGNRPFQFVLPDLSGLYAMIDEYLAIHRKRLMHCAPDPETFFVKTVKASSKHAAYDQSTFYEAWRLVIQRYGVFNPYTGRGAIKGLLPHGPHNIRDVLATHILKRTGSFEQASYAIQDTPQMVAKHYGRFLPQDKAAMAARILNKVWEDSEN